MNKNGLIQMVANACSEEIAKSDIESFFGFIDMPDDASGIASVKPIFSRLYRVYASVSRFYPRASINSQWGEIATELKALSLKQDDTRNARNGDDVWGLYEKHPVYVALHKCPKRGEIADIYLGLLIQFILASQLYRHKKAYKNICITAPQCIRKAMEKPYQARIEKIDPVCYPMELSSQIIQADLEETLSPLITSMEYYTGKKSAPIRISTLPRFSTGQTLPVLHDLKVDTESPEEDEVISQITLIEQKLQSSKKDSETKDLAPNEIPPLPPMVQINYNLAVNRMITLAQSTNKSRSLSRSAIQMHNQCLPYEWSTLSTYEISLLWESITDKSASPAQYRVNAVIALMLLCGQPSEKILRFAFYTDTHLPENPRPGLQFSSETIYWIVPGCGKAKKQEKYKAYTVNTDRHFRVELPHFAHRLLRRFTYGPRDNQLFNRVQVEDVKSHLDALCHDLCKKHKARITPKRLEDYLFAKLQQQEGADITSAAFITGKDAYLATTVRHYTAQRSSKLAQQYHAVWAETFAELNENKSQSNHRAEHIVGSANVPLSTTLGTLIHQLKTNVCERKAQAEKTPSIANMIRMHNSLTRYTCMLVAYATGVRAVHSPMPRLEDIDFESGFCVLSDKDNADGYHTRLTWLAPICLEQLAAYRTHIKVLFARISVLDPDFFHRVAISRTNELETEILFVRQDGRPASVRPKSLHNFGTLPTPIYLPGNANRHLLRSWLLARQCPKEIIDAYMGHWFIGQEPWGLNSSLSPHRFRTELSAHIPTLLDQLGFEEIGGLKGMPKSNYGDVNV